MRWRAVLREPLLHFLLIGAALFLFFQWKDVGPRRGQQQIVVAADRVALLAAAYEKAWGRPPTDADVKGLVEDWVREEVAVREATAAGLDRDDTVIRRRLRQKFELMVEEQDGRADPTDTELEAYLKANSERFVRPATVSFEQILLSSQASDDIERLAANARRALERGADPASLGQHSMLPSRLESTRLDLVGREFGADFAATIGQLQAGKWSAPIRSPFGMHIVRVTHFEPAGTPELADVRAAVERDWEDARRRDARAATYRKLLEGYEVVIEKRPAAPTSGRR